MLGLIMVANMIPGLMIGLRRNIAIDYDAVAYRTGAILAEDPGWSSNEDPNWEYTSNVIDIQRFGLALSKETPNILSLTKIEKFNGTGINIFYPNDYRERLIFGDYPYRFNISIQKWDGTQLTQFFIGEHLPNVGSYGYIRRVVRVKSYAQTIIDLNNYTNASNWKYNATCFNCSDVTQTFATRLNFTELLNPGINPVFQFNPLVEPIIIQINNFSAKFNWSSINSSGFFPAEFPAAANDSMWNSLSNATFNATLSELKFSLWDPSKVPSQYSDLPLPVMGTYSLNISDQNGEEKSYVFNENGTLNEGNGVPIYHNSTVSLTIYPTAFSGMPEILTGTSTLDIRFIFKDSPPRTLVNDIDISAGGRIVAFPINYSTISPSMMQDGWLEVAVW